MHICVFSVETLKKKKKKAPPELWHVCVTDKSSDSPAERCLLSLLSIDLKAIQK